MINIANKHPTLQMKWSVLGNDGRQERALAFTTKKRKNDIAKAEVEAKVRPVNTIAVGDRLRLELYSDMDGYLTLFDFGTSGRFTKLFPCPQLSTVDNHIEAGKKYAAPGELLPIPDFLVSGPTTAQSGRQERLLVIVTRNPIELSESSILNVGTRLASRCGCDDAEVTVASLLDIPEDEWTYGLLETEVV